MKFTDGLLKLYRQGLTNNKIADKLGVTQISVYRFGKLGVLNNCIEEIVNPESALEQEEPLPEQIRLQRIRTMMRWLLDYARFHSKGKGIT